MPSNEEIDEQQTLLVAHRRTLAAYLKRAAIVGEAHLPPEVTHGIIEARNEIRRIKATLQSWGVPIEHLPNDEARQNELVSHDSPVRGFAARNRLMWFLLISIVTIAVIGMIGAMRSWLFSLPATQAPIVVPLQASRAAEANNAISTVTPSEPTAAPKSMTATPARTQFPSSITCPIVAEFGSLMRCEIATQRATITQIFEATEGDQLYYRVLKSGMDQALSLRVRIFSPSDEELFSDIDSSEIKKAFTAPNSGTYTIRVEGGKGTGNYVLYLQRLNKPLQTQTLMPGQQLDGLIALPFQHNAYSLETMNGESVHIEITKTSLNGIAPIRIIILDPHGTEIRNEVDSCCITTSFDATLPGPHLVLIYASSKVDYKIERFRR